MEENIEIIGPSNGGENESAKNDCAVKYHDRVFELSFETLMDLIDSEKYNRYIIKRMYQNGLQNIYPDGVTGCVYCSHLNQSPTLHKTDYGMPYFTNGVKGSPLIRVEGCDYVRMEDVLFALGLEKGDTKETQMAIMTPCAMYDSRIAVLAERGALNQYEVSRNPFTYPKVCEMNGWPELLDKYQLVIKENSFLNKLKQKLADILKSGSLDDLTD